MYIPIQMFLHADVQKCIYFLLRNVRLSSSRDRMVVEFTTTCGISANHH